MIEAVLLFVAGEGLTQVAALPMVEPDPKVMSQKQIREHNAKVPRDHPFYIRCVSSPETGSLVKRTYSCRTNHQWEVSDVTGNQNARETYDKVNSKFWETSK